MQEQRGMTARTIRSAEVMEAERQLLQAIKQRVKAGDLEREQAEAGICRLLGDIWTEAERVARKLPGKALLE